MSRTYKDRPKWVKDNDKKGNLKVNHLHHLAGEEIHEWLPVSDENGNQIMETVELPPVRVVRVWFTDHTTKDFTTTEYLKLLTTGEITGYDFRNTKHISIPKTRERPLFKKTVVGYRPLNCTATQNRKRPVRYLSDDAEELCFTSSETYRRAVRPMHKHLRTTYHASERATERNMLHRMTKDSSTEDLLEDKYEKVNTRQQRHVGYWD